MKERIDELVEILNEANYNYHVLDNPTIEDVEYDNYLRELYNLEEKYPDLVRDEENTPIMDDNGEFKIEFREARKEELIPESNYYLAQKDYLDYMLFIINH